MFLMNESEREYRLSDERTRMKFARVPCQKVDKVTVENPVY